MSFVEEQVCLVHEAFTFDSRESDLCRENEQTVRKLFFSKNREVLKDVSPHKPPVGTRCILVATSVLNYLKQVIRSASSSGWICP